MKTLSRIVCVAALLVALAAAGAGEALAFRMIQNTGVGRFSAGAAVSCSNAGGFTHWTHSGISWYLNTANQGNGKASAVQSAMASWTAVSGANHSLSYAGTTTAGFSTDGRNTLLWANGNGCTGSCLALTALVLASGQVITETDVTFNNAVTWTTNGNNYDTQAVTTHELGHTLGIHHTNLASTPRPTMYAYYFGSGGRSLETDDRSALQCAQNRYPISGAQMAAHEADVLDARQFSNGVVALSARPRPGGALIRYTLQNPGDVKLDLFDVSGRHIQTLVASFEAAGDHEVAWDGSARFGTVRSGVYFARIQTPEGDARATVILAE